MVTHSKMLTSHLFVSSFTTLNTKRETKTYTFSSLFRFNYFAISCLPIKSHIERNATIGSAAAAAAEWPKSTGSRCRLAKSA